MPRTSNPYASVGKMILEEISRSYGARWQSTLSTSVQRDVIAARCFVLLTGPLSTHGDPTAQELVEHGRSALAAAYKLAGLNDEEE